MLQRRDEYGKLCGAWRLAADEVWATWNEVLGAPRTARRPAYDQHLKALADEAIAACDLAHCGARNAGADVYLDQAA